MTKHKEDKNWEDRWRETLGGYQSTPTTEDWSGMKHLLETQTPELVEAFADPNTPRFPEFSIRWFFRFWPQSLLGLLLLGGLGFSLGQCQAEEIANEIKSEIDFFSKEADPPPNYDLVAADTVPADDQTGTTPRCTPGPGYRIRTYQAFDEKGKATGRFEQDTVWMNIQEYRYDTIYRLDEFGNLTDSIYSIDSTKVAGLHNH